MASNNILDQLDTFVARYNRFAGAVPRGGLGVTILLAGIHKLIAPAVEHAYLAPPLEGLWPTVLLPLNPTFVLFGVSEVLFGLLLLANWHTPTVAILTALSLLGVVMNLALGVIVREPHVDVLIRDIGLTLLAFGVALDGCTFRRAVVCYEA